VIGQKSYNKSNKNQYIEFMTNSLTHHLIY